MKPSIHQWKEEMLKRFANPDPLSSKGQFDPKLQGRLWKEFENFISSLLTSQLEEIKKRIASKNAHFTEDGMLLVEAKDIKAVLEDLKENI